MQLPAEFVHATEALMGRKSFERYLHSFEEDTPVSIRLNPMKTQGFAVADVQGSGTRLSLSRFGFFKGISFLCILVSFTGIGLRTNMRISEIPKQALALPDTYINAIL